MRVRYDVIAALVVALATLPATSRAELILTPGAPTNGNLAGAYEVNLDCATPTSEMDLCITMRPDVEIHGFVALDVTFDLFTGMMFHGPWDPLQPFWDFNEAGCNPGGLSVDPSLPPGSEGFPTVWGPGATNHAATMFGEAPNGTGDARLGVTLYANAATAVTLEPGNWYYVGRLRFASCAASSCPGCSQPVTLVPLAATLIGGANAEVTNLLGTFTCISINNSPGCSVTVTDAIAKPTAWPGSLVLRPGAVASTCEPVATRRSSWGALKLIYR